MLGHGACSIRVVKRWLPLVVLALGCKTEKTAAESAAFGSQTVKSTTSNRRSAHGPAIQPMRDGQGTGSGDRRHRLDVRDPWAYTDPLDHNADGTVTHDELVVDRYQRAEDLKVKFDANGDGTLTLQELGPRGHPVGIRPLGDPEMLDTDKNGEISTDEIDAVLEERQRARSPR